MSSHDHSYHPVLGKFNADAAAISRSIDTKHEELRAAYQRIDELAMMLGEARLQLEYLHEKFQPTGTSEAVLARIDAVLS